MIPLSLRIKNFLSYGPDVQAIDFGPYPLICLSGKNGHGKSALLDAITWAVWGCARKISGVSKADEGLMRLGQTQMMVALDFLFNGQTYRVRREFALTYGKPYAALDFGILNRDTKQITSLTDKTIRGTQEKIESLLGLDYETFINSAFLRQGQSNEFSKKSSKERKEILASILGLDRFEKLRKKALEKVKEATQKRELARNLQERILLELEQSTALSAQLTLLNERLLRISEEENNLHLQQKKLTQEKDFLVQKQHARDLVELQLFTTCTQEEKGQEKLRDTRAVWKKEHRELLRMPDLRELEKEKKKITEAVANYQELSRQAIALKERVLHHKEREQTVIKKIHEQYTTQLHEKKLQVELLQARQRQEAQKINDDNARLQELITESAAFTTTIKQLTEHASYKALEHELSTHIKQFEKRKNYYQRYITHGNFVKSELSSIQHKQKLSHDDNNPSCPLCEQNLSASRKKFLKTKFSKQEEFLQHRLKRLARLITALKDILITQHESVTNLQKKVEGARAAETKLIELRAAQEKITVKINTLKAQTTAIQASHAQMSNQAQQAHDMLISFEKQQATVITSDRGYQELRQRIADLEHQLAALGYDATAHAALVQQAALLEKNDTNAENIRQKAAEQQQRKQTIHELITQLRILKKEKLTIYQKLEEFKLISIMSQENMQKQQDLETQFKNCIERKEDVLQEKGKLENQQQKLRALEAEYSQQKKSMGQLETVIEEYQALAIALSKDGVQAFLIEDSIPEIEQEANHLLAKLTDNQAHLIIESLRDLKKGGTKETLDIKISDPMGIRPYELFSGGEAFRIDFALRIAISKLLARRAGTSLQTLIIDEGFGSQDEEGLTHIMDALYKIQDDFAKIIIVSHLSSMKDQFPVHFLISKGAQGSTVQIMEQD